MQKKNYRRETFESELEQRDKKLFNDAAESYSRKDIALSSKLARRHRLLQTISVLPPKSDLSILEVGCGSGYTAEYLSGLYSHYTGIDYSEGLIAYAKKENSGKNIRFIAKNINNFDAEEKFDIVLLIGVLHHFDNYKKTFNNLLKFLKPGGWLLVNEPQSANILIQISRKLRALIDKSYSKDQLTFSPDDLYKLFKGNGLKNCKTFPQGIVSTPLAEVIFKPDCIFGIISKVFALFDRVIEHVFGGLLKYFSWNIIVRGQKD